MTMEETRETTAKQAKGLPRWAWPLIHAVAFAVLFATDEALFEPTRVVLHFLDEIRLEWEFFREFGSAWATIVAVVLIWRLAPSKKKWIPFIIAAVIAGGLGGDILKVGIGRVRPNHSDGQTMFVAPFSESSASLPSSHASTAMANAAALGTVYPPARPVFMTMAVFTGLSRVDHGRHFLSDVYAGWVFGYYATMFVYWLMRKRRWVPDKLE